MTERAKQHRLHALRNELTGWEGQIHSARSEQDRLHAEDRVATLKRDIALCEADGLVLGNR
jgi:hypothetical protein